jgi:WD40 repeat protein
MLRTLLGFGFAGVVIAVIVLYVVGLQPVTTATTETPGSTSPPKRVAQTGAHLLAAAEPPARAAVQPPENAARVPPHTPIVIEAHIAVIDKVDIPALRDGRLLVLGTEVQAGENVPDERKVEVEVDGQEKIFRRLKEGDTVKRNQLIGVIDPAMADSDIVSKRRKLEAAKADARGAEAAREEYKARWEAADSLKKRSVGASKYISDEEHRSAFASYAHAVADAESKQAAIGVAEAELNVSKELRAWHNIRAEFDGTVMEIYRNKGESVKNLDQVVQLQNHDRIRIDGRAELQYLPYLEKGKKIIIEPTSKVWFKQMFVGHLQAVNGVAVGADVNDPTVVSASEDTTARVWSRGTRQEKMVLRHPAAVRAVACSPAGSRINLCVTGSADGFARVWDLSKDAGQQPVVTQERHKGPIYSVAFTPDGNYFATGGDRAEICIWRTNTGELKYRFPAGHLSAVTSLQFLPGMQLLSTGKDNSILLWKLTEESAKLDATRFDRRGGTVSSIGASPDGKHVLFDKGTQIQVLSLPEGKTEGVLQSAGNGNFTATALFSPDSNLILTASGSSAVQLWRAPTDATRAYETRQYMTAGPTTTTCGAFAQDGSFAVTGTNDGVVYVWPVPAKEEFEKPLEAEITRVDNVLDGQNKSKISAEMVNPGGKLIPGTKANMVLYPKD